MYDVTNKKNTTDYVKIDLKDVDGWNLLNSRHVVFGALWGKGLIERYDVYRVKNLDGRSTSSDRELIFVKVKLGNKLNGHDGVVHGGIVSMLLDETIGWGYEYLQSLSNYNSLGFTANLNVDFRSPLLQNSDVTIRVYHNKTKGRKVYFSASMQSVDGRTIFAEATALFLMKSDKTIMSKL